MVIESAQRSREERDNVFWAFDVQTRFLPSAQFHGTFLFDDIHFSEIFENLWTNRFAFQIGMHWADPLLLKNTSIVVDYTRIEPYTFSHGRSRDNDYGSLGAPLGPRIGPNADSWFFRVDILPARNLSMSFSVSMERQGENVFDSTGTLVRNVGGDILQPHRDSDPATKVFLDGTLMNTRRAQILATYECVNQTWLDFYYEFESIRNEMDGKKEENQTYGARIRIEL
jgi:hypothetical protein